MHELSYVKAVIKTAERFAKVHKKSKIKKINLRIGKVHQIVPSALKFMFGVSVKGTILERAKLGIKTVLIKLKCVKCKKKYLLKEMAIFLCPGCGFSELEIISGREFEIESIEYGD